MGKLISKMIFVPPMRSSAINPEKDVILTTKHVSKIQVRIVNRKAKLYLLISHGNAEDLSSSYEWAMNILLKFVNVNVVIYGKIYIFYILEYTGYGNNIEGIECSERFIYNDIKCVYQYLTQVLNIDPEDIILYGRSLGSGPSCYLAEKYKNIGGLILNGGFLSAQRVVCNFRFTMPFDIFPNIDRMNNIKCPVLILHSIKDDIVPFNHGKELYGLSKHKFEPLFVDGSTHNNLDKISEDIFKHMNKFLNYIDSTYMV